MPKFNDLLNLIVQGMPLTYQQALDFQNLILNNNFQEVDLVSAFGYLESRPLTYEELKGFYDSSKKAMVKVETEFKTLDTCGTGGDQSGSFNISTVAAIIASADGVPVAKHGNRAASSKCGSADVLEALGVNIDLDKDRAEACLKKYGFVFLMAKNFHPAFRFAAPARKIYGKRTYFNLLGPLLNPASAEYRVHGFADTSQVENLGKLLMESGVKRAWLVHSEDGLDEISPCLPTKVREFAQGEEPKIFEINPERYGYKNLQLSEIKGGDAKINAKIIENILNNEANQSQTAVAVLNAAAGLAVFGKAESFEQGIEIAKQTLASGKALEKLGEIRTYAP